MFFKYSIIVAAAAASFACLYAAPASALPTNSTCRITTYYANAEMEREVGVRSTCSGTSSWGRTSAYHETETIQVDNGHGSVDAGDIRGLPCEFLAGESEALRCVNLPRKRP